MQNFRLIRSSRRTLSIEVHPDGEVLVRAPRRLPKAEIERFLREKEDWIQRKQAELSTRSAALPPREFKTGETFLYQGQAYPLALSEQNAPLLSLERQQFLLARAALAQAETVFETWYRAEARRVFSARLTQLAAQSKLQPQRLRLSSARTRWGSCSSSGTICLNWRLILAPPEILDYVILHELAHLRVKNHQRAFWDLVGSLMPDYAARRKWLKENGSRLQIR